MMLATGAGVIRSPAQMRCGASTEQGCSASFGVAMSTRRVTQMVHPELAPTAGALEEVRRLAGSSAAIQSVMRLEGGQHADTWRVDTAGPELTVVVRQFPAGDSAGARERQVLDALDGLEGLAPVLLGSDPAGRWAEFPTTLISWLDGQADITPTDPEKWAAQLGRALATVHAVPGDRLAVLPSVFDRSGGLQEVLAGPLATRIRSGWKQITASVEVLTHCDYWSGNVVWRDGKLTGIVDWADAARGPRGFDLGWCRLDLVLLFDERIADVFLAAYEDGIGRTIGDIALWDSWAVARSHGSMLRPMLARRPM
jgi:aminoglycoside phosphotransferase (APT) family kinase protein